MYHFYFTFITMSISARSNSTFHQSICVLCLLAFTSFIACLSESTSDHNTPKTNNQEQLPIALTADQAAKLIQLPLECIQKEYPYKAGLTISGPDDLALPRQHHPAFYGCFDWHSAVHGHWSVVYLLSTFPDLDVADKLKRMLRENLSKTNIETELDYFSLNEYTKSFERTYGWAWLLKLAEELDEWDDPIASELLDNIQPLADFIASSYISYLPKLAYPIRVGEHSNTAFGLSFAYDYAAHFDDSDLLTMIEEKARSFYMDDVGCPITWEPSGYDFLSPCLQEVDIMRKVLDPVEFKTWLASFLPELLDGTLELEPGVVLDRSDGKLVHLSGLNFSRAWCLYPLQNDIAKDSKAILALADRHINASINDIVGDHYSGGHWLGSFILYALKCKFES